MMTERFTQPAEGVEITKTKTPREKILDVFRALRKLGYAARANYLCCGSCATYNAPANKIFFYWHAQDEERAFPKGRWASRGSKQRTLMLGFCRPEGATDADLTAAARLCVQMLEQQGLKTEWDGTNDQRIGVLLPTEEAR